MLDALELPEVDPATPIDTVMRGLCAPGMPFETVEQEIDGITHTVFKNQPPTMREVLMMLMAHDEKEYLVYGDTRLSFKETLARATKLSQALVDDLGVKKGDRVALAMRNYPEWPIAYMAIVGSGGIAVLMNAWWTEEEMTWAMNDCGAKIAVCDAVRASRLSAYISDNPDTQVLVARDEIEETANIRSMEPFLEGKTPFVWPSIPMEADDPCQMLYTSGSTGFPKGAYSSHRAVNAVLFNWIVVALSLKMLGRTNPDPDFQPVMLVAVPFFHVTGLMPVLMVSAIVGRKLVLMHKWDVEMAFQMIDTEGVTSFTGVPTMSYDMAASPLRKNYDLSTLVDIGGGGAARPPEHVKLIKEAFKDSSPGIGYGLTETGSLGALLSGEEYAERPNSVGKATPPMVSIKIAGADGSALKPHERGEICIKSVTNVVGYWNNEEATARAFKDGWMHTGDVGYVDDEGYVFIVDRMKDIIIRAGENISSLEVEGVLHAHEKVEDVMVFSLPCPHMGEIVGAAVVPGEAGLTTAEILNEAKLHLAAFKIPEKVWIREEAMPLIASGKIDRKAVKSHYQDMWQAEQEGN